MRTLLAAFVLGLTLPAMAQVPPVKAPGRPSGVLMVLDQQQGKDVARQVTTTLLPVDGFESSVCGKVFKLMGTMDDAVRSFSCPSSGGVGTGSYVDGSETGNFEWGYALESGGSKVRVKTYAEWEDPRWKDAAPELRAVQIYYRFTTGPKAGKSYTTLTGPQKGSAYQYMFRDYFAK